jgi:alginate O-acetyltransferase complex protein AlgI
VTFSSVLFLFFFLPVTLAVSYVLHSLAQSSNQPNKWTKAANLWLIATSIVFYGWSEPRLIWLLLASGAVNFTAGLLIEVREGSSRKWTLAAAIAANLCALGWFKYSGLLASISMRLEAALGMSGPSRLNSLSVALPLGISFYTFHGISYVIDVYRRKISAERRPFIFCLYYSLFPQLVAGPIVRYSEISGDLLARSVSANDVFFGMRRFAIGLAKKTLIANPVSVVADGVFAMAPENLTSAAAWAGVTAYALQIYFDFSGYSDMAIGIGRALGFHFPENFDYPYCATSVRDFWRRWHMTLTRWFRDYLYFPLGGNRCSLPRQAANLVIVFALCGLWHGASWTFLGWGLFHGFFLSAERVTGNKGISLRFFPKVGAHLYTMAVVCFGWVLFRSESWNQTLTLWRAMVDFPTLGQWRGIPWRLLTVDLALAFGAGILASTRVGPWIGRHLSAKDTSSFRAFEWVQSAAVLALFFLSLVAVGAGSHNPFIYYRF